MQILPEVYVEGLTQILKQQGSSNIQEQILQYINKQSNLYDNWLINQIAFVKQYKIDIYILLNDNNYDWTSMYDIYHLLYYSSIDKQKLLSNAKNSEIIKKQNDKIAFYNAYYQLLYDLDQESLKKESNHINLSINIIKYVFLSMCGQTVTIQELYINQQKFCIQFINIISPNDPWKLCINFMQNINIINFLLDKYQYQQLPLVQICQHYANQQNNIKIDVKQMIEYINSEDQWEVVAKYLSSYIHAHYDELYEQYLANNQSDLQYLQTINLKVYKFIIKHANQQLRDKLYKINPYKYQQAQGMSNYGQILQQHIHINDQSGIQIENLVLIFSHIFHDTTKEHQLLAFQFNNNQSIQFVQHEQQLVLMYNQNKFTSRYEVSMNKKYNFCVQMVKTGENNNYIVLVYNKQQMILKVEIINLSGILYTINANILSNRNVLLSKSYCSYNTIQVLMKVLNNQRVQVMQPSFDIATANLFIANTQQQIDGLLLKVQHNQNVPLNLSKKQNGNFLLYSQLQQQKQKENIILHQKNNKAQFQGYNQFIIDRFNYKLDLNDDIQKMLNFYSVQELSEVSYIVIRNSQKISDYKIELSIQLPQIQQHIEKINFQKQVHIEYSVEEYLSMYVNLAKLGELRTLIRLKEDYNYLQPKCIFQIAQYEKEQIDQLVVIILTSGQGSSFNIVLLQQLLAQLIFKAAKNQIIDNELHCVYLLIMLILKNINVDMVKFNYIQLIEGQPLTNSTQALQTILYYLQFLQFDGKTEDNIKKILQIINYILTSDKGMSLLPQYLKQNITNWIINIFTCLQRKINIYIDNILTFYSILTYYSSQQEINDMYFIQIIKQCCKYQLESKNANEMFQTFNLQDYFDIPTMNADKFSLCFMKIIENIINSNNINFAIQVFDVYFATFNYNYLENFSDHILSRYASASTLLIQILCYLINQQLGQIYEHLKNVQIVKRDKDDSLKINSYLEKHLFCFKNNNLCLQMFYFNQIMNQKYQQSFSCKIIDNLIYRLICLQDQNCAEQITNYQNHYQQSEIKLDLDISTKMKLQQFLHTKKSSKDIQQAVDIICAQQFLDLDIIQYFIIPLKKQFSQLIYQYIDNTQHQNVISLLQSRKYEQFAQLINKQSMEQFHYDFKQKITQLNNNQIDTNTSMIEQKSKIFTIPSFIFEYEHFKNIVYDNNDVIDQIMENEANINNVFTDVTQRLVQDVSLIDNLQYSQLNGRLVQQRRQYYNQILIPDKYITFQNAKNFTNDVIYCTQLLKQEQYIMSIKVKRFFQQNINGEVGILIVFAKTIVYISNANFYDDVCNNFSNLDHIQFYYMTKINCERSSISGKLQDLNQAIMYQSPYLNYFYNARIKLSNLSTIIYITKNNIYNIVSHMYNHRYGGFEIILKNAHILNFSVYDQYTEMQDSKSSQQIQNQYLSAELARGLLFYVFKKQFNITVYASFMTLPRVFISKIYDRQFYSISRQFIIGPDIVHIQELKKVLQQNINQPVAKYAKIYSNYLLKLYQHHKVIKKYNMGQMGFELFEPKLIKTILNSGIGLDYKKKHILACNQLCVLYLQNLITAQMFILYINLLSSRVPDHLSQTSIFPIVKNRDLKYPVQAQNKERRETLMDKIKEYSIPSTSSAKQILNQQLFQNGTFTSNSANTLYYMFRVQPYTTALIDLQSNKFDYPDRMFHSYDCLYRQIFYNNTKEHIQQFYYSMRMFLNLFNYKLEFLNNGLQLDDLHLQQLESMGNQSPLCQVSPELTSRFPTYNTVNQQREINSTPILTEDQLVDLSSDESQVILQSPSFDIQNINSIDTQIPQNYFSLQQEFNRSLENVDKYQMLLWIQLFFGTFIQNPEICNQYPGTIYYLTASEDSNLLGELDKMEYFGTLNQPFCGEFKQIYLNIYQYDQQYCPQKQLYNNFVEGNIYIFYDLENSANKNIYYTYNGIFLYKNIDEELVKLSKGIYVQFQYKIVKEVQLLKQQLIKLAKLSNNCLVKQYRNDIYIYNQNDKEIGFFSHSEIISHYYAIEQTNHIILLSESQITILQVDIIEQQLAFVTLAYQLKIGQMISHVFNQNNAILTFLLRLEDKIYYYQFDALNYQILYVASINISYKYYANILQSRSNYTIILTDQRIIVLTNENIMISNINILELLSISDNQLIKCTILDDFYDDYFIILYTSSKIYVLGYDYNSGMQTTVAYKNEKQLNDYQKLSQDINDYYVYGSTYTQLYNCKLTNNIVQMKISSYGNFQLVIKHQFKSTKPIENILTDQHINHLDQGTNDAYRMIYVQLIGDQCQTIQLQKH